MREGSGIYASARLIKVDYAMEDNEENENDICDHRVIAETELLTDDVELRFKV